MTNNLYATTGMIIDPNAQNTYTSTAGTALKQDSLLFNYLFTTSDKLKEQNKKLYLFFDSNLQSNKLKIINDFINERAIKDLDVSLLKSALIMTENHEGIDTAFLYSVYQQKINR